MVGGDRFSLCLPPLVYALNSATRVPRSALPAESRSVRDLAPVPDRGRCTRLAGAPDRSARAHVPHVIGASQDREVSGGALATFHHDCSSPLP